jgi:FixJ family two-component response regulator
MARQVQRTDHSAVAHLHLTGTCVDDDDRDIRETLAEVLRDAGYRVQKVPDGETALERL